MLWESLWPDRHGGSKLYSWSWVDSCDSVLPPQSLGFFGHFCIPSFPLLFFLLEHLLDALLFFSVCSFTGSFFFLHDLLESFRLGINFPLYSRISRWGSRSLLLLSWRLLGRDL